MSLYPREYQDIINHQQLGRHQNQLSLALIYDEIIAAVLDTINVTLNDIVATQLRNLRPSRTYQRDHEHETYDPVLHMDKDQYEVYSIIIDALNNRRSPSSFLRHRICWHRQVLSPVCDRTNPLSTSNNLSQARPDRHRSHQHRRTNDPFGSIYNDVWRRQQIDFIHHLHASIGPSE